MYSAFSLSPSFPGPPEVVDVTLVLVFLCPIGHRFEYNASPYFFSGLAEHTGTQKFD